jgi:dolichyl-phosphate-mannose--protein O-mannosyl transferase
MAHVTAREEQLRRRLLGDRPVLTSAGVRWGWLGPLLIAALGGLLRFWHLDRPPKLAFDETYYVKEGWSLIRFGTEMQVRAGIAKPDDLWNAGTTDIHNPQLGNIVVHPPIGKWVIGLGEWAFGADNPFGWRFSVAVLGTVSIVMVGRIALRLFGSVPLAAIASLLLAFEGLHFTMSRTALLDMVVMFFALAGFGALLVDRDRSREVLARRVGALPHGTWPQWGPWLGWRPWRWLAGLMLALATSTKWSGLLFVAAFGLMTVWWDLGARRAAGVRGWGRAAVLIDGPYAVVQLVLVTAAVYPLTWLGWFRSEHGYLRNWARDHPGEGVQWLPEWARSFVKYHQDMWAFNTTLTTPHSYQSNPWGWMVQARPTSFYYEGPTKGQQGCIVDQCSQAVHTIGTISFWWAGVFALFVVAWWWLARRDWRAGAIMAGVIAGYGPWFYWQKRTIFAFYELAFEPYVALAIVFCLGLILQPALERTCPERERRWRIWGVAAYLVLGLLLFAFFYPIHAAEVIPYDSWYARMWFPSWV